jgi:hypothetical protein
MGYGTAYGAAQAINFDSLADEPPIPFGLPGRPMTETVARATFHAQKQSTGQIAPLSKYLEADRRSLALAKTALFLLASRTARRTARRGPHRNQPQPPEL